MKKLIALILVLIMALSAFGCKAEEAAPAPAEAPAAAPAEAPAEPAEAPAEAEEPAEEVLTYPHKTVTMIVPYGAGGTTDLIGRQMAAALGEVLGITVVVENQAGASGAIGCQATLDAAHDGSVVLFNAENLGFQRTMGLSELSYADFRPVMATANDPKVVVVAGDSPYNTIQDLLDAMAANPNKIQMSYTGPGGSGHIQALLLNKVGYYPALTAYTKAAECIVAVIGGQVEFFNSNYSTVASYIESGELKILANCANERLPIFPDIPCLGEIIPEAQPYLELEYCPCSLLVAADFPEDCYETLVKATKLAVETDAFKKFMEDNCMDKMYEKYTTEAEMLEYYSTWESIVSWILYDAGVAAHSPEEFGIAKVG